MPCSNCHSEGRSLRTKLPVLGDLSMRGTPKHGVGQQPSHEHGAEATAPCDRQVMASDGVFT